MDNQVTPPRSLRKSGLLIAILIGVFVGLSSFTVHHGEGLSYLSNNPNSCVNCHIMQPQFDSWQKASHHTVATCVDCHLPNEFASKWVAKAENGYLHSKAFTFQDFAEPIEIREINKTRLHANCIRCHSEMVHELLPATTSASTTTNCFHCHRSVGHGQRLGLGKFEVVQKSTDSQ